jgi:hypothetical protein
MGPKMFLSPRSYNFIYSESTGIIITEKIPEESPENVKNQNKKLKEQNLQMKKTLEYLAKYHSDHATGLLAKETLFNLKSRK